MADPDLELSLTCTQIPESVVEYLPGDSRDDRIWQPGVPGCYREGHCPCIPGAQCPNTSLASSTTAASSFPVWGNIVGTQGCGDLTRDLGLFMYKS